MLRERRPILSSLESKWHPLTAHIVTVTSYAARLQDSPLRISTRKFKHPYLIPSDILPPSRSNLSQHAIRHLIPILFGGLGDRLRHERISYLVLLTEMPAPFDLRLLSTLTNIVPSIASGATLHS